MMRLRKEMASWRILSVKAFLGESRSGKGWGQALSVWVPSTTQPLGIGSQEQEPDNDLQQKYLELAAVHPPPSTKALCPVFP